MSRIRILRRSLAPALLGLGVFLAGAAFLVAPRRPAPADPNVPLQSRVARTLADQLPQRHLSRRPMDETLAANAMDLFLSGVDFDRTVFLQTDITAFQARIPDLVRMLNEGDLAFAMQVFDVYRERLADRLAFSETTLKAGFDFTREETYTWRRQKAPWPATPEERDELWRKKLQNETLARMLAVRFAAEEAQKAAEVKPESKDEKKPEVQDEAKPEAQAGEKPDAKPREPEAVQDAHLSPEEFVLKRQRQYYLMIKDSDEEWILERFFSAFTRAYDPHSEYLSPVRSEDFNINMSLKLVGVGAMLSTEDGLAKVERVIPGGPIDRDGRIQPNDRIVAIAQGDEPAVDILHWPLYRVVRLIRGELGTRVTLVVWPASDISGATERRIELVRDEVKLEESAASGEVREAPGPDGTTNRIGILKLPEFYADFEGMRTQGAEARRASRDVRKLLEGFRAQNVDGVVFDLRNNGGGSLPDAIEIAGLFIQSGPVVQIRDEQQVQVASDPDPDVVYDGPLVVLINRMSASASEIVAAALQDYRRALIVGDRRSHGKGTVQTLLPLNRNDDKLGQIKITTASFYRIAGGSTQLKGVEADIPVSSPLDAMEVGEESLPHALPWTRVEPSFYAVFSDAVPPIDGLRTQSETRRKASPEFVQRDDLVQRIGQRVKSETVSLNLEERTRQAQAERELEELQRTLADDRASPKKSEPARDLLLQESLEILGDMISARAVKAKAASLK
jgi:carboxyl-terminal processing protease